MIKVDTIQLNNNISTVNNIYKTNKNCEDFFNIVREKLKELCVVLADKFTDKFTDKNANIKLEFNGYQIIIEFTKPIELKSRDFRHKTTDFESFICNKIITQMKYTDERCECYLFETYMMNDELINYTQKTHSILKTKKIIDFDKYFDYINSVTSN